jgi:hypothetical protein
VRHVAVLALLLPLGCSPDPASTAALRQAEVAIREGAAGPEGSDAPPRVEVTVRAADGRTLERAGIAAARLAGGAAIVLADRTMVAIDGAGEERVLAGEVEGAPIADDGGARIAFVDAGELRVADGTSVRTVARTPGPMSPVRWIGDHIVLIGGVNGGVAGVWIADSTDRGDRELRCVTNCALRAGTDWGGAYVPPPDPATIAIEGSAVSFELPDGARRTFEVAP